MSSKNIAIFVFALLFCIVNINSYAATKSENLFPDKFYQNNKELRPAEADMRKVYDELMDSLSFASQRNLQEEQEVWAKNLNDNLNKNYSDKQKAKKQAEALKEIKQRIADLGKLASASKEKVRPFNLPIEWLMTKAQVCEALGIENTEYPSYKMKLFGEEVEIYLKFTNFLFFEKKEVVASGNPDFSHFSDFIADVNKIFKSDIKFKIKSEDKDDDEYIVTSEPYELFIKASASWGEEYVGTINTEQHDKFNKKYKKAFLSDFVKIKIWGKDKPFYGETIDVYDSGNTYLKLSYTEPYRADDGVVDLEYIDKNYALLHIDDIDNLFRTLLNIGSYKYSLTLLPENANLTDVLLTFSNRKIEYAYDERDNTYTLSPQFDEIHTDYPIINILMNNKNEVYGYNIFYVEEIDDKFPLTKFLNGLKKSFNYLKKQNETVAQFIGDIPGEFFETEENYILLFVKLSGIPYRVIEVLRSRLH